MDECVGGVCVRSVSGGVYGGGYVGIERDMRCAWRDLYKKGQLGECVCVCGEGV